MHTTYEVVRWLDAQSSMRNCVMTVTPHNFKPLSASYCRVHVVKDYKSSFVTDGIMPIPDVINFRPAIL
jgi:hypothetical protein